MNVLHPDGHMIAALFLVPAVSIWLVGYINYRLAAKARRRSP